METQAQTPHASICIRLVAAYRGDPKLKSYRIYPWQQTSTWKDTLVLAHIRSWKDIAAGAVVLLLILAVAIAGANALVTRTAYGAAPPPGGSTPPIAGSCMPIEDANVIFEKLSGEDLGMRINDAIIAFNEYAVQNPGVRVYSDTAGDYRAWRDGQLPQDATVIVWTDLAGTVPEVLTPADNLSPHTLDTDFRAVTNYIQGGWGFFVVYGPVMMNSPFGGALMCGQYDGTNPVNFGHSSALRVTLADFRQPTVVTSNRRLFAECMPVATAHKLFNRANGSINWAIRRFDRYVKNHPDAGFYGNPGSVAWKKKGLRPHASFIVWSDLQGHWPTVLTPGRDVSTEFVPVKNYVQGTWGLFVEYSRVRMHSGYGAIRLCGQFSNN